MALTKYNWLDGFVCGVMVGICFMAILNGDVDESETKEKTLVELQIELKVIEIDSLKKSIKADCDGV
jgi:hypothetical protein